MTKKSSLAFYANRVTFRQPNMALAKGIIMPATKTPIRKRSVALRVMVTAAERREMKIAAAKADLPLAVFIRTLTLAAIKRGEAVSADAKAA
jgi:hypothetical protein